MNTELVTIFTDSAAELNNLESATPSIDLTDSYLTTNEIPLTLSNPNLYVSSPVSEHTYYDIQFMLANNFWGCGFNFGNSACGIQVRQGIAHLIDKTKFTSTEPSITGIATAIDNPVPPVNGGLPAPNPCAWDSSFLQSGSNCIVGSQGGTAYHLATATGANGVAWLPAPGSPDLNAAAQHFVNAGIATGFDPSTSILTSISSAASANPVTFFIRNDESARLDFGNTLAQQICYLFTGTYATPCSYLSTVRGSISAFPGFNTSPPNIKLLWGMYTGSQVAAFPFDQGLFQTYNSRFVSGIPDIKPPTGSCSGDSVPSSNAPDYMYLCNSGYDTISSQIASAPCYSASGDPVVGQPNNGPGGNCSGTSQLSSISAGVQTEDAYGSGSFSIPMFSITGAQFAYLSNWQRVINDNGSGIPNFFTWLNAYSPNPAVAQTVRQGFSEMPTTLNPFIAETPQDFNILRNIYDSLYRPDPSDSSQILDWMTLNHVFVPNTSLSYSPPPGTTVSVRNTLTPEIFWQDGTEVTVFDIAFSYLSLLAFGSFQSRALEPVTGITILSRTQFDLNLRNAGALTNLSIGFPTIIPGRYWSNSGTSAWDAAVSACHNAGPACYSGQYALGVPPPGGVASAVCLTACMFSPQNLNADPLKITASYDPVANHILVGSGPWQCGTVTASSGSGSCSSSGTMIVSPGGSFTLTRFGVGVAPGSSLSGQYFRSSGRWAVCIWAYSACNGDSTADFIKFAALAACYGRAVGPPSCQWQAGIGNPGGNGTTCCVVLVQQVSIAVLRYGTGLGFPFDNTPPSGIGSYQPVLYEGAATLNPASIVGCSAPYPTGGYDC